jgi:hypothetical protein
MTTWRLTISAGGALTTVFFTVLLVTVGTVVTVVSDSVVLCDQALPEIEITSASADAATHRRIILTVSTSSTS